MPTVAICVNKNNLSGLTPYLSSIFGKITDLRENRKFWVVSTVNNCVRSELLFDKNDFRSSNDLFGTINAITR